MNQFAKFFIVIAAFALGHTITVLYYNLNSPRYKGGKKDTIVVSCTPSSMDSNLNEGAIVACKMFAIHLENIFDQANHEAPSTTCSYKWLRELSISIWKKGEDSVEDFKNGCKEKSMQTNAPKPKTRI